MSVGFFGVKPLKSAKSAAGNELRKSNLCSSTINQPIAYTRALSQLRMRQNQGSNVSDPTVFNYKDGNAIVTMASDTASETWLQLVEATGFLSLKFESLQLSGDFNCPSSPISFFFWTTEIRFVNKDDGLQAVEIAGEKHHWVPSSSDQRSLLMYAHTPGTFFTTVTQIIMVMIYLLYTSAINGTFHVATLLKICYRVQFGVVIPTCSELLCGYAT
ncbi:major facilitator superfamily protein [Artemisia annua]|uniref:Major facilitator superfamily protein n=1 Tax=Artemisia annua TaxID=35608 RepID=A0A2U1NCL3_ARTAN|nr:major facilitator superfamily protein [Artemisia annua]